jgi:uncharacterized protein
VSTSELQEYRASRIHSELPLFRLDTTDATFVYAPGHPYRVTKGIADQLQAAWMQGTSLGPATEFAQILIEQGQLAHEAWHTLGSHPYRPVCLTIYPGNQCYLRCVYCFAAPARRRDTRGAPPRLGIAPVAEAARWVAENCRERGLPLTVGFHGGGEPTANWRLFTDLVGITQQAASERGIGWWGYVATNGVLSDHKANWLARQFNLIGLSCDGPPDIQDRQRPTARGHPTAPLVVRNARSWAHQGTPFLVRATITPETLDRQTEIVRYLFHQLGAREIHLEPVYRGDRVDLSPFDDHDAPRFAQSFLAAQRWAFTAGVALHLSGSRFDEIHGPYCNLLRDVLQITPVGDVGACFLDTDRSNPRYQAFATSQGGQPPSLNVEQINDLRRRALRLPTRCTDCFNQYHCARACPDQCPALTHIDRPAPDPGGFRCLLNRYLGINWITTQSPTKM